VHRCTLSFFRGQSVVIETQEAAKRCILRGSFDTADSLSKKNSIPRHSEVHRRTLAHFQRAIGCNKDAANGQQMYIARFFRYSGLLFREKLDAKTLRGAQTHFATLQRAMGCNKDARSSQQISIARCYRYSGLFFREKLDSKTPPGAQTHFGRSNLSPN